MSTSSSPGRHRAPRNTSPLTGLSAAVASNAGSVGRQAAVVVAASGLVLGAGLPAHGTSGAEREVQSSAALTIDRVVTAEVTVPATATVSFARVAVEVKAAPPAPKATPKVVVAPPVVQALVVEAPVVEAPVVEAPVVEAPVLQEAPAVVPPAAVQAPPVVVPAAPVVQAAPAPLPAPVSAPAAPVVVPAAAPVAPKRTPAPAPAPSSGIAAGLVGSAYSQIGVGQDCTAMVEKALRSVGKSVGDLAPGQFYQFGDVVGSPAPGDLVITGGHVAIYVGNGQVISGGLNGMNTGLHNLSDLPGAGFVRVR
ncbi:NlpC/P60 family protein [Arthrobacter sp. Ld5]|uniref:NlpC/P60 family protein n=1 Tax=Arthrobacter sp. Ld5 TaxID=649152 RepID=UPI003EBEA68C